MPRDNKLLFDSYQVQFDPGTLAWAIRVHYAIFGDLPLTWTRKGTWIEAWNGKRRIAFAPHKNGASIYFQGSAAVNRYRDLGGRCPTGRVCIRIPVDAEYENRLMTRVAVEHLQLRDGSE